MKQNQISDPNIFEIFRVDNLKDIVDSDGVAWNSCSLLQKTMMTFQPNLFQPEVLIRVSTDSPLIRTRIEEVEIEEKRNSTVLYAELWNLGDAIKKAIADPRVMNRTIAIERRSGRLQAVALTVAAIPENMSIELLNKACEEKGFRKRSLFHLTPEQLRPSSNPVDAEDGSIRHLLVSIKNYLEKQISEEKPETDQVKIMNAAAADRLIKSPPPVIKPEPEEETMPLEPYEPDNPGLMNRINEKPQVVLSRFKNKRGGMKNKHVKRELPRVDLDEGDIDWVNSGQQMNWKQRKNKDRTIVDLAERVFNLSKKKHAPTREMIISFLASLSGLQLEFMEDLIECLNVPSEVPTQESQKPSSTVGAGIQKRLDTIQVNLAAADPVVEKKTIDTESHATEPQKAFGGSGELAPSTLEEGEYTGVSDEEMQLHRKILETQKKYNVSYDHAAGMVLK